jgi:hypothetical protein
MIKRLRLYVMGWVAWLVGKLLPEQQYPVSLIAL